MRNHAAIFNFMVSLVHIFITSIPQRLKNKIIFIKTSQTIENCVLLIVGGMRYSIGNIKGTCECD